MLIEMDGLGNLGQRLGALDPQQIRIWRAMSGAQRLEIAFQAYQFALEIIRLRVREENPNLSEVEFNWEVTRRMQSDPKLASRALP